MSRLTEHQIRALLGGMESTLARYEAEGRMAAARRVRQRLNAYRAELAERTGKLTGFSEPVIEQVFCSQQTDFKNRSSCPGFGGHVERKNALAIAGDQIAAAPEEVLELGKVIGRRQAFGMLAASCSAADAQLLKRIKETGAYKALGLDWEHFCPLHLGADRKTVERIIANLDAYGAAYFNLRSVVRVSPATYGLLAEAAVVNENTIEFDGEKIAITKANAERITELLSVLRKAAKDKDEQIQAATEKANSFKRERDNARKAIERARQEFAEYKKAQAERFPNADPDHSTLLDAQSLFDLAMSKLAAAAGRELSPENQARFIGLSEYMYRDLIQMTHDARARFGKGWNMADPNDLMSLDQVAGDARNLIQEHVFDRKN